jgi:peptidoglycan/LPS O-acetylase OafA/YrhL
MSNPKTDMRITDIAIVLLTLATAAIHFSRAMADPEIRVLFILNGLGYLVLLTLLYLPQLRGRRPWIRRIFIGYAALTIVLYFVWGLMSGEWNMPIGPLDKLIEVALIALLWQARGAHESRGEQSESV